jgi:peptidoglycan/LPS O-acetylase OafA/YrhL
MSTKKEEYLVQLDGLRMVAVLMVLYDHWRGPENKLPFGELGVTLFFVLSGFLITRILLTSKAKTYGQVGGLKNYLKKFYIRRTIRIFPIYYLSILVLYVLQDPSVRGKMKWAVLYATNFYTAIYEQWLGVIDHFWSLAVEEQFYIFFPMLIFFIPARYLMTFFYAIIVLSVGLRWYLVAIGKSWVVPYVLMPTCLDAFGLGAIMAYIWMFHQDYFVRLFSNYKLHWLTLGLLVAVVVWSKIGFDTSITSRNIANDVWERLFGSLFFFFLIGGAVVGYKGWMKTLLEHPISSYLGRISYGIYIYHNFVYNYYHSPPTHIVVRGLNKFYRMLPFLDGIWVVKLSILLAITTALASISWFIIEKPINALKDKFSY